MRSENAPVPLRERYTSISPLMLVPGRQSGFIAHVLRGKKFVPYTRADERLTPEHRSELLASGVAEIYVHRDQEALFRRYLSGTLGEVLQDASTPSQERARALGDAALCIAQEALRYGPAPSQVLDRSMRCIQDVLALALDFLSRNKALAAVARLVAHDYRTFAHSVHVFLYSSALLQACGLSREMLVQAGLGALLHDLGKALIPEEILCKKGALPLHERREINTHPTKGLSLCACLALPPMAEQCILLHHEKLDGSGYPHGLRADDIPQAVRAVTIADIYDAMTSDRPYSKAMNPFQALRIMRDEMFGEIDLPLFQRFTKLLSGA